MERTVTVALREGLHARPAALFVQEAARQPVAVTIRRAGVAPADATSILAVMTLDVSPGETVTLATAGDGPADAATLDALAAFLGREHP